MIFSRDSILALERHFLGALSTPATTWLEPLPAKRLAFAGTIVRSEDGECVLDLGTVTSPGRETHTVRVSNPGSYALAVRIGSAPDWLTATWNETPHEAVALDGADAEATLVLTVSHDTERSLGGTLRLIVEGETGSGSTSRIEELAVRMIARRLHPIAVFDFNGSPAPRPFDFGAALRPYELSVANRATVPLIVSFADLPAWLTFEVDGSSRNGPLPGRFFERHAPVTVKLHPRLPGRYQGTLQLRTNDPRPAVRSIDLSFAACVEPAYPCVRMTAPPPARLRADQTLVLPVRLENRGIVPARLEVHSSLPHSLEVPGQQVIPGSRDGDPGTAMVPLRIVAAQLAPGNHVIEARFRIDGGDPAEIVVPVHVEVTPAGGRAAILRRPEAVAMLIVLFLLAVLFAFALRGLP